MNWIFGLVLTIVRISLVLFLMPFFSGGIFPITVRAAMCVLIGLAIYPEVGFQGLEMPQSSFKLALMFLGEVFLGLLMDIIVRILFAAVQTGGQLIGFQMGFAMMNVIDPLTGTSEAITAQFLYQCAVLLFLSLNGHLFLIQAMSESFALVPPGSLLISPEITGEILRFSSNIFFLSIKIAAPAIGALFLVDLSLALISRMVPQMNVLFVGFPLKVGVGFLFMTLLFVALARYIGDYLGELLPIFRLIFRTAT